MSNVIEIFIKHDPNKSSCRESIQKLWNIRKKLTLNVNEFKIGCVNCGIRKEIIDDEPFDPKFYQQQLSLLPDSARTSPPSSGPQETSEDPVDSASSPDLEQQTEIFSQE